MPSAQYADVLAHIETLYTFEFKRGTTLQQILDESRRVCREYPNIGGQPPVLPAGTSIVPVSAAGVPSEWVCADNAEHDRRLLWIHGGGWIAGSPETYRHVAETLSRELRASVLSVDYRLAPEHPYPAGLEDCLAAWTWLGEHGPRADRVAHTRWMAGDSAGANLVLASMLALKQSGDALPHAAATIGVATDLTASGPSMVTRAELDPMLSRRDIEWMAEQYVPPGRDLCNPLISPLFGELQGLPPIRMHVGDREVLLDDTLRFAERAAAAGVTVEHRVFEDMMHVFEVFCHVLPEARESLQQLTAFLDSHASV